MSLLSNFTPPERQRSCKVRSILEELEAKDAAILLEAINDHHNWPARTLSNALGTRNIVLSDLTIGRHRKGSCSC